MTDETRLAAIRTMLDDTERARERLHGLMGPSDRARAPVLQAALDLLAFAEVALPILRAVTDDHVGLGGYKRDVVLCYNDNAGYLECPWCNGTEQRQKGLLSGPFVHEADCPVTLARRALGAEGSK